MAYQIVHTVCLHHRLLITRQTVISACRQSGLHLRLSHQKVASQTFRHNVWPCQKAICKWTSGEAFSLFFPRAKFMSLSLISLAFNPFAIFRPKHTFGSDLSAEVLAHIPREVFRKDTFRKRKHKYRVTRLLLQLWSGFRFWTRFCGVLLTFTPLLVFYPLTYLEHSIRRLWWRSLLFALEISGPTFIKLGQWASTRRDLFSSEFCELFYRLHDSNRVHSWYMTKSKLKKAFGKRWREIFVRVDKKPIGSGCVAQVHKAYMRTDMIPDELLVEECLEDGDSIDDNSEIDFAEGLEILGFGKVQDKVDQLLGESDDHIPLAPRIYQPKPPQLETATHETVL